MIEHTEVEVDEPVEAPHQHAAAPVDLQQPPVRDVLIECLAHRLPCPVCKRTEPCRCVRPLGYSETAERAALIENAMRMYGHLPPDEEGERGFDAEETARWLADRSGFARYTEVADGWRRLMEAERDVELASIKALQRVPGDEVEMVKAAKAALLAWHQSGKV